MNIMRYRSFCQSCARHGPAQATGRRLSAFSPRALIRTLPMHLADPQPSPAVADAPDFCVVLNAASGRRKDEEFARALRAALDRHPGRFALSEARSGEDLSRAIDSAIAGAAPVLVAAGGDGTIAAVAEAAVRHGRALGIVPTGTFNFVARSLGIPPEIDAAVNLLVTSPAHPMPVAEVNGRLFLNNASLGLYPAILREREDVYRRWGRSRLAAHWSLLKTVFGAVRPLHLRVTVDGKVLRARSPLIFIARSAYQLDSYGLEGADAVRAGRFAVFLAPDVSNLRLFLLALRLAIGGLKAGRDIELVTGEDIVVETDRRRLFVARDGERTPLASPLHFRIRHDSLRVVAPEPPA
jgi:diacylglycerol kinase family enzyme